MKGERKDFRDREGLSNTLEKGGGVYAGALADAGIQPWSNSGTIWGHHGVHKLNIKTTLDYHTASC